ncbi:MAG: major Facilitator superfamily [halophilic archaeon J07HX64]|nr:MAG: major Facilitator superfamily [halophilic archaeon J07HX64]
MMLAVPALVAGAAGLRVGFDEEAAVAVADGGDAPSADIDSFGEFLTASREVFTVGFLTVFVLVLFNGLYYRGTPTFLPELLSEFLAPLVDVAPEEGVGPIPDGSVAREFDLSRYLYAGLLAVGIGGQYVGGKLTDRIKPERGLALMLAILVAIALVFIPASGTLPTLVLVSVALGFALFAVQPMSQATIAACSPPEHRGLSFGYTYLAIFGVGALGASFVGTALAYGSPTLMFLLLAGFVSVALGLALSLVVRRSRD